MWIPKIPAKLQLGQFNLNPSITPVVSAVINVLYLLSSSVICHHYSQLLQSYNQGEKVGNFFEFRVIQSCNINVNPFQSGKKEDYKFSCSLPRCSHMTFMTHNNEPSHCCKQIPSAVKHISRVSGMSCSFCLLQTSLLTEIVTSDNLTQGSYKLLCPV